MRSVTDDARQLLGRAQNVNQIKQFLVRNGEATGWCRHRRGEQVPPPNERIKGSCGDFEGRPRGLFCAHTYRQ